MKNIKKYILGFLATLMLCITSVVSTNNTQNEIVVNAEESSDMVYVGTPINPTASYDKIYVNTNIDSVVLNEKLNFIIDNIETPFYLLYCDANLNGYGFEGTQNSDGLIVLHFVQTFSDGTSSTPLFSFASNESGFYLENVEKSYDITLENGVNSVLIEGFPLLIGQFNEYINDLISSTPFDYVPIIETEWKGTAINPTGTYDRFYLNTSLSQTSVNSILEQFTLNEYGSYMIFGDEEDTISFAVLDVSILVGGDKNLAIVQNDTFLYVQYPNDTIGVTQAGWQQFDNPILLEQAITGDNEITTNDGTISVGQQNYLSSELISSTPFYRVLKPSDNVNKNESMIVGLLGAITTGITGIMTPIINGIKNGFNEMFINGETLTPIAYFLIGMFGLSIGIGLVWLVFSIMKKRK